VAGYLLVIGVAFVLTALLMPVAIRTATHFGVLAAPDADRRLHSRATPLLGGVAMCLSFVITLALASRIRQFREMFNSSSEPLGIAIAALIITGVGLLDDVVELSAPAKLAGQVLAGSALYLFGTTLDQIPLPLGFGTIQISADLTPLVTVLWVVGMANAINLIDGLDGLAAGLVAVASAAFLLYGSNLFSNQLITGSNVGPLVAALLVGICLGFLPYNFSPAKIFMGDAGAMLLGLLLAASTMVVGGRAIQVPVQRQTYFFFAPLFIPIIILAVPIGDTLRLIVTRTIRRTGVATADRDHLHYRLVELGHGPRRTVVILCSLTAIFSGFALAPLFFRSRLALIPLVVSLLLVVWYAGFHPQLRAERRARDLSQQREMQTPARQIRDPEACEPTRVPEPILLAPPPHEPPAEPSLRATTRDAESGGGRVDAGAIVDRPESRPGLV
jgi:UDP-GlcNAc:undecaprenyl-phosphate/decaprenyl-phosphate GlcNAc-1-phosphate transferase